MHIYNTHFASDPDQDLKLITLRMTLVPGKITIKYGM